mmetsp:Transcript_13791/g.31548  ORF Transcript_13791/g.31548 Transcript_13791/m.31548 type:complete len:181 (+) Transcript_13791:110-652(+)
MSRPHHPLWQNLLSSIHTQLTAGSWWDRINPMPDPVALTGPRKLEHVFEEYFMKADAPAANGEEGESMEQCVVVKPHVFYPGADSQAGLVGKCVSLLKKAARVETTLSYGESTNIGVDARDGTLSKIQLEACRKLHASLLQEGKSTLGSARDEEEWGAEGDQVWAVHHWSHTWIPKKSQV